MNFFGFGIPSPELRLTLEQPRHRASELPLFHPNEKIAGVLTVLLTEPKQVVHQGLTLQLLGLIDMPAAHGTSEAFTTFSLTLQVAGQRLEGEQSFPFVFPGMDSVYDSYHGTSVTLRYVLRATLARGTCTSNLVHDQEIWMEQVGSPPVGVHPIQMEVGIQDCLQIEFKVDQSNYHLTDVIQGKIFFLLIRIKIKSMTLAILRRERVGTGPHRHLESETVTKFEIMDGAPVKGDCVPVRLYLAPYALTPTYRTIEHCFSVHYYLHLVLLDEEDRRYFKQHEITFWRQAIG